MLHVKHEYTLLSTDPYPIVESNSQHSPSNQRKFVVRQSSNGKRDGRQRWGSPQEYPPQFQVVVFLSVDNYQQVIKTKTDIEGDGANQPQFPNKALHYTRFMRSLNPTKAKSAFPNGKSFHPITNLLDPRGEASMFI